MCQAERRGAVRVLGRKPLLSLVPLLAVLLLALTSCAAGPDTLHGVAASGGHVAGFWLGLWHGIILPITFIVSLFNHHVNIYEVHNNGNWYNFGFVLGAGVLLGGSGTAGRRARKG